LPHKHKELSITSASSSSAPELCDVGEVTLTGFVDCLFPDCCPAISSKLRPPMLDGSEIEHITLYKI